MTACAPLGIDPTPSPLTEVASPSPAPSLRSEAPSPTTGQEAIYAVQLDDCAHPSGAYRVQLPAGWWVNPEFDDAELGTIAACRWFAPDGFDVTTGDLDRPLPVGAAVSMDYLEGGCVGYINAINSSRDTTVAGYQATITELAFGKTVTEEAFTYEYVVILAGPGDCAPEDKLIYARTRRDGAGDYTANTEALDAMMETIEISIP